RAALPKSLTARPISNLTSARRNRKGCCAQEQGLPDLVRRHRVLRRSTWSTGGREPPGRDAFGIQKFDLDLAFVDHFVPALVEYVPAILSNIHRIPGRTTRPGAVCLRRAKWRPRRQCTVRKGCDWTRHADAKQ